MTALDSALRAPAHAPQVLGRCRELVRPALVEAVGRMHPWVGEMAAYSFGCCEVGGAPTVASGGKGVRQALAVLGPEAAGADGRAGVTSVSNATPLAQVAASLQACRVAASAAACTGVDSSFTYTTSFTQATLPGPSGPAHSNAANAPDPAAGRSAVWTQLLPGVNARGSSQDQAECCP